MKIFFLSAQGGKLSFGPFEMPSKVLLTEEELLYQFRENKFIGLAPLLVVEVNLMFNNNNVHLFDPTFQFTSSSL